MSSDVPDIMQTEYFPTADAECEPVVHEPAGLEPVALGAALLEVGLWISRTNGLPAPAGLHKSMGILQEYVDMDGPTLRRLEIFGQALLATRPEIDHVARRVSRLVEAGHQQLVVKYVRRVSSSQQWRSASIRAPKQSVHVPVTLVKATGISWQGEAIPQEPIVPKAPPKPQIHIDMARLDELKQQTSEVQSLLALHLDSEHTDHHEAPEPTPVVDTQPSTPAQPTGLVEQAVAALKAQPLWSASEIAALARQLGVFPGKLVESVNAWSNELYDDDFIYDDDPYEIQLELLAEGA
ncbi:MAG: tellurite resistance TerB C-terminal domain-containing protein [Armatimonadota bacterium]